MKCACDGLVDLEREGAWCYGPWSVSLQDLFTILTGEQGNSRRKRARLSISRRGCVIAMKKRIMRMMKTMVRLLKFTSNTSVSLLCHCSEGYDNIDPCTRQAWPREGDNIKEHDVRSSVSLSWTNNVCYRHRLRSFHHIVSRVSRTIQLSTWVNISSREGMIESRSGQGNICTAALNYCISL
jgi:hypothetical protein